MLRRTALLAPTAMALLVLAWTARGTADVSPQKPGDKKDGREAVATCLKIDGALLQRTKDGFKTLKAGDKIAPNTLLIGFPEAELVSSCGMVNAHLHLYFGDMLPITEAAVIFHDDPKVNADITLERGVITLKGLNDKGDTVIRLRGGDQVWELHLKDADSTVLVARFGRHEPGTDMFKKGPKKGMVNAPLMHMGVLVLKGKVIVSTGHLVYAMNAPPGPALITYDSSHGAEVKQLETLPEEVTKLEPADQKLYKEAREYCAKLAAGDIGKGLDELVGGDSLVKRRVAVACMGAVDDLGRLWTSLENTKHIDVRQQAVLTLRNWLGRQPGQLTKLNDYLTKDKKYSAVQARTMIQLLKGFDDEDRKEPIIYQLLIDALEFAPLPTRELAHWHLERLAPAGQKIAYDAAADEASRQRAVAQWRKLIPDGQLPPAPKKDEVKKGL